MGETPNVRLFLAEKKGKGHWAHKLVTITPLYAVTWLHQMCNFVTSSQAHSSLLANILDTFPRVTKESTFLLLCLGVENSLFSPHAPWSRSKWVTSCSKGQCEHSSEWRSKDRNGKWLYISLIDSKWASLIDFPQNPKLNRTVTFTYFAQPIKVSVFSLQLYKIQSTLSLEL